MCWNIFCVFYIDGNWIELDWIELNWIELNWIELRNFLCLEFTFSYIKLRWPLTRFKWNNVIIVIMDCIEYFEIKPRLKYWMPIHYDTTEDGQNKKISSLFSFLVRFVLFLHFIGGICIYLSKEIITSFHWLQLNNYTPYENKCFNPRNQNHRVAFVTRLNFVCLQMRYAIRGVHTR